MKKIFALILLLLCSNLWATEIQCQTDIEGVDAVIKKSPDTGFYYLLVFQGNEVKPIPLTSQSIEDTPSVFCYKDERLYIEIDLSSQKGMLHVTNESKVNLSACYSSDKT